MSFVEGSIDDFVLKRLTVDFQRDNGSHMTRVYPAGIRIGSANFDPTNAWNCECQLVALNYQTESEPMWLNDALFSLNGVCGSVLKPQWMIEGQEPTRKTVLKVNVICGGKFG
jgi:phosphatidylinositol phospholipase C delta